MMLCNVESTWCPDSGCNNLSDVVVCTVTGSNEALSCRPAAGGVSLLSPDSESPSPCMLKFLVNAHAVERVIISSIDILCDAKNAEIFGDHEEYIATSRGTRIDDELDLDRKLFFMQHSFDTSTVRCTIKLLSLTETSHLWIHSIYVSLERSPMTTNTLTSPNLEALSPTIDLDKVKVMLTDLDHDIPNNAKSLLRAMEAFQKNRQSSLASALTSQVTCPTSMSPTQMSSLLAMFTSMQVAKSSSNDCESDHGQESSSKQDIQAPNDGCLPGVTENMYGNTRVEDMQSESVGTETVKSNCNVLQIKTTLESSPWTSDTNCIRCGSTKGSESDFSNVRIDYSLQDLEKRILSALGESEARILDKVRKEVDLFEKRINTKLDLILSKLTVLDLADQHDAVSIIQTENSMHGTDVCSTSLTPS